MNANLTLHDMIVGGVMKFVWHIDVMECIDRISLKNMLGDYRTD